MHKSRILTGLLLLSAGAILLTENLSFFKLSWSMLWPTTPLVYGLYLYYKFYQNRDKDALIFATLFSGVSLFSFLLPPGLTWEQGMMWWPIWPLFWGLGIFLAYLIDRRDTKSLLNSTMLMVIGGLFLVTNYTWAESYLKYWPVILIVFGTVFLCSPFRSKQEPT